MIEDDKDLVWLQAPAQPLDETARSQAEAHQSQLTKPQGSLGRLETLALQFAAWQGVARPQLSRVCVRVYAADHGVCAQKVSAFPQVVTTQMITNFLAGGAAISVLCRSLGADLKIYNLGTAHPVAPLAGLQDHPVGAGTEDFTQRPAMTRRQLVEALEVGASSVPDDALHVFIGGEMGIGNTTSASALYSVLLNLPPKLTVGPGTGVDQRGVAHKREVVEQALGLHHHALHGQPQTTGIARTLAALRCLGGFEIAALVGAYIACAQRGVPVLVDGFISTAAALCAVQINPGTADWLLFAHCSAEPAHTKALEFLEAEPLLDLQMRLGEGSGAALALPILQAALNLHNDMATFADAGVSSGQNE